MPIPLLLGVMGLLTVVGVYFWWVHKPKEEDKK
jgi:hypothetical protein